MPLVTSQDANVRVGHAAAEAFVKEAKQSPLGEIRAEYDAFLQTLSQGAQKEFDGYVLKNAPDVAAVLQLAPKLQQQDFAARSDAVWKANFAREDTNKAIFTDVFGAGLLVGRERHQMDTRLSKGPNDEVIAELSVWKPAARQPALGFMTEGLGSAKLQFDAAGNYTILEKKP